MSLAKDQASLSIREDQFRNLLESAKAMGEVRDLDELLDFLAQQASAALKADRCSIFLVDRDNQEIWSKVSMGAPMIRFPEDLGIAGETIASGQAIILDDAYADDRFNQDVDKQTGYRTHTLLSVPMRRTDGSVIGCFESMNKQDGAFGEPDLDYLQAFANQAAVAIETSLLYQEQEGIIADLERTKGDLEDKMEELSLINQLEHMSANAQSLEDYTNMVLGFLQKTLALRGLALVVFDEDGVSFLPWTAGSERVAKYTLADLYAKPEFNDNELDQSALLDGQDIDVVRRLCSVEHEDFTAWSFTYQSVTGNQICTGRLWLSFSDDEAQRKAVRFEPILTHQLSSAINRFRLAEQRQRAQRFATIGHLSSTIIHDLRNPMTAIRGFAELIEMSTEEDEQGKQTNSLCEMIIKQVDRCSSMIDELLQFTRGEKNYAFERENLTKFLHEIGDILRVETDRLEVRLEVRSGYRGELVIDREKIMRAIFNLTNNALGMLQAGDKLILSAARRDDGWVEIRVSDTGPGVPASIRHNLFDLFVTEGKAQGTGLGLHITKDIVEAHGGMIYLDENWPKGASFVMCFDPQRTVTADEPEPSASDGESESSGKDS